MDAPTPRLGPVGCGCAAIAGSRTLTPDPIPEALIKGLENCWNEATSGSVGLMTALKPRTLVLAPQDQLLLMAADVSTAETATDGERGRPCWWPPGPACAPTTGARCHNRRAKPPSRAPRNAEVCVDPLS